MNNDHSHSIEQLISLLVRLRDPKAGVPWDQAQTFDTITKHTIEEAYEVVEAVENKDWDHLKEELGDLLLQIVYFSQMAAEKNLFNFSDVSNAIVNKIMRRYKDVFNSPIALTPDQVAAMWNKVKAEEKKDKPKPKDGPASLSFGSKAAPALTRAFAVVKRASADNMQSGNAAQIAEKTREELDEVLAATSPAHRAEELGDVLFSAVSLCAEYDVDAEHALQAATNKFIRRWQGVHDLAAADGLALPDADYSALENYWSAVKTKEKAGL